MTITETMNANRGTCRSCGAPIWWAITPKGSKAPVVLAPEGTTGNVRLRDDGNGELRALYVKKPDTGPYVSHFATCPNAQRHRRR